MVLLEEERSWPGDTSLPLDPEFGCYASDDFTWRTWIHRFTHKAGWSFWAGIFQPAYWHHNSWCEFSRPQAVFEYTRAHTRTHANIALQCHYGNFYSFFIYFCTINRRFGWYKMHCFVVLLGKDIDLCLWYGTGECSYQHLLWCDVWSVAQALCFTAFPLLPSYKFVDKLWTVILSQRGVSGLGLY